MKKGNRVVLGIFDSRAQVESCVENLKSSGFRSSDVSVLLPEMGDPWSFAHEKSTKAPEGTTAGTGFGAVLGGALGWLIGAGVIAASPVLGPFIAAGPIMAALAGVATGGAIGGLTGALIGFGFPEYEAKRYETFVAKGGILLSAHADDVEWADKAHEILELSGARDVSTTRESSNEKDMYAVDLSAQDLKKSPLPEDPHPKLY